MKYINALPSVRELACLTYVCRLILDTYLNPILDVKLNICIEGQDNKRLVIIESWIKDITPPTKVIACLSVYLFVH